MIFFKECWGGLLKCLLQFITATAGVLNSTPKKFSGHFAPFRIFKKISPNATYPRQQAIPYFIFIFKISYLHSDHQCQNEHSHGKLLFIF
jgi:hypothetical protein